MAGESVKVIFYPDSGRTTNLPCCETGEYREGAGSVVAGLWEPGDIGDVARRKAARNGVF